MKYTVLDLTQNILSALNSDEVNSISDTVESRQVAEIVRTCYFNIITRAKLPEHMKLIQLTASGDPDFPVLMYRPDNVRRIDWIKYDTSLLAVPAEPEYTYVTILPMQQFLDMVNKFNPATHADNVDSFLIDDITFYFKNDKKPEYCTIHKDFQIIFDSYDSAIDGTLQNSKTLCYGQIIPTFEMINTFIPEMDEAQFPLLLNEAKSLAFLELKQMSHEKAEQESRRQWRTLQKNKSTNEMSDFDKLPNFGRMC
jgi:hypothetical protein